VEWAPGTTSDSTATIKQEYTALSDELFLLLNQAISVAVNTTSGAAGP
jgi:hypothetical protein